MSREQEKNPNNSFHYMTVRQIANDSSFCFTVPMLRYYVLHTHKNGLMPALRRIGKKILIRRDLFIDWIEKEQLIARFALAYIERDNRLMFDSMLKKLSDSSVKKFILVLAGSRYPEYVQENIPEDLESLMSDDELINLAQPLD